MSFPCSVLFYSLLKKFIRKASYSMAFNGNCSMKISNIALLLEKKQMLTRFSKFSSKFPQLKGFVLITHVNNQSYTQVSTSQV